MACQQQFASDITMTGAYLFRTRRKNDWRATTSCTCTSCTCTSRSCRLLCVLPVRLAASEPRSQRLHLLVLHLLEDGLHCANAVPCRDQLPRPAGAGHVITDVGEGERGGRQVELRENLQGNRRSRETQFEERLGDSDFQRTSTKELSQLLRGEGRHRAHGQHD